MQIRIDRRFRGPPESGNGGYCAGMIASAIAEPVKVRLAQPVPMDSELTITARAEGTGGKGNWEVHADSMLIATATAFDVGADVPQPPSWVEAFGASQHFAGFGQHLFPGCFVCGPARAEGDGLRVFPGSVPGTNLLAAPWRADASLADENGRIRPQFIWAALDCPGYFATCFPNAALLGELAVKIEHAPRVDEPCVVTSWQLGVEGRKHRAGTALFDSSGQRCALGVATWIELKR